MPLLDVFNDDAFGVVSMTTAIDKLPHTPTRLGSMNLFEVDPLISETAVLEERHGTINIINTAARGTTAQTDSRRTRKARSVEVPHLPFDDAVLASEVSGVRAFGSESQLETVAQLVNEKLTALKRDHNITWEYHRAGAIKGVLLDADASTIIDWFTFWSIIEKVVDFDLDNPSPAKGVLKKKCLEVIRHIDGALGATVYNHVHALCGDAFFDALIEHADVYTAFEHMNPAVFSNQQANVGNPEKATTFQFGGITWENYRGSVGGTAFIPTDDARFFPVGSPGFFKRANAPADFIETVNTRARPIYAKQARMKFDKGVEIHTQSNPLHICTRPSGLVKGTRT